MKAILNTIAALLAVTLLSSCTTTSKIQNESISSKIYQQDSVEEYSSPLIAPDLDNILKLEKIAIVCCNNLPEDEMLWQQLTTEKPDLIIMAGNTVPSVRIDQKPLDKAYKSLDQNAAFQKIKSEVPFLATWDDLDYGLRNGDSKYPDKMKNKGLFINYWKYIKKYQSPTINHGVEHSVTLRSEGKTIQIILLDVRSFATPWIEDETGSSAFKKNWDKNQTLLGKRQWHWLKKELRKKVDLRLIISPLPVASNTSQGQRWGLLPYERQKLFDLIRSANNRNTFIISGHQNFGALARVNLKNYGSLLDMTVGPLSGPAQKAEQDPHYYEDPYVGSNYGLIDIDWRQNKINFTIKDLQKSPVQQRQRQL